MWQNLSNFKEIFFIKLKLKNSNFKLNSYKQYYIHANIKKMKNTIFINPMPLNTSKINEASNNEYDLHFIEKISLNVKTRKNIYFQKINYDILQ